MGQFVTSSIFLVDRLLITYRNHTIETLMLGPYSKYIKMSVLIGSKKVGAAMSRTASHCYSSVVRLLLCFCSAVILFDSVPCTAGVLLSFCRYCVYSDSTLLHVLLLPCCLKRMFVALSPGLPVLRVRDSKSPTYGYNILRLRTLLYIFIEIEVVSYPF